MQGKYGFKHQKGAKYDIKKNTILSNLRIEIWERFKKESSDLQEKIGANNQDIQKNV